MRRLFFFQETLLRQKNTVRVLAAANPCRPFSSGSHQGNLTSLTNKINSLDEIEKWENEKTRDRPRGVPRKQRTETTPITVMHESHRVIVANRSRCNNFFSNQFLIADKQSGEAVLIDASDDWPDDWAAFLMSSRLTLKYVFLTHCHIDNIINLNPLLQTLSSTKSANDLQIAWCSNGEDYWVRNFSRACERYHRFEMVDAPLPLHSPTSPISSSSARNPNTTRTYNYLTNRNMLLSTATNRSTSFLQIGNTLLFYIFSPGHSPGHMMLSVPTERLLFSGDVLFYNAIGRVDLPYASGTVLAQTLRMLEEFPDSTVVLPGHGRLTTLGHERRNGRALRTLYERMEHGCQEVSVGYNSGYL